MATSSIFHNVIIDDQKKADSFISAIEESISDPYERTDRAEVKVESDPQKLNHIIELWKNRRQNN